MNVGDIKAFLKLDTTGFAAGLGAASKQSTAFQRAQAKMWGAAQKAASMAMGAMVVAIGLGIKEAIKFEQQMAKVNTMLSKNSTVSLDTFAKGIRGLAKDFGQTTEALSNGLYDILSASVPAEQALRVLEDASRAAVAGFTDTGVAADVLTTMMNAFGDTTYDSARAADVLFATVVRGKCVTGDTRVLLADGRYRRIDSLEGENWIVSWDYRSFTPALAQFVDMGTKQTVQMTTRDGRVITTTPEHPYLTPTGWKRVDELGVGDRIAVPSALPFFGTVEPQDGLPTLLGLLIAEGSMKHGSPRLAIGNEHVLRLAEQGAKAFGVTLKEINQSDKTKCPAYMLTDQGKGRPNRLTEALKSLDAWGRNCYTKRIPDEVYTWRKDALAEMLHAYFTGDGWLCRSGRDNFCLGFSSVNEELTRDIAHLLLRFGVAGTIRKSSMGSWAWEAKRYAEIKRFMEFIGIERDTVGAFSEYVPLPRNSDGLTSTGGTPREKREYNPYPNVTSPKSQIQYERIKSLEDGAVERVFDLTVPMLHNFVANDIVAHNTTFPELAGSIGNVATLAARAGLSMEELAAELALMTRAGLSTDIATTNLKGVLVGLLKPTDELTEALDGMTLETDGFAAIMEHISDLPVDTLSRLFPNVRGLTGVITSAKGLGAEIEIIHGIMEDGSPTRAAYNKAADTTAFRMAQVKEELKATAAEATERLLPTFENMVQVGKRVIMFVLDFKEAIITFLVLFKTVPVVLKLAQAAMIAFGSSTTIALGPIALITAAIAGIGTVIALVATKRRDAAIEEEELHKKSLARIEALREAGHRAAKERLTASEALALGEKIALDERAVEVQWELVEARKATFDVWNRQVEAAKAFRQPVVALLESEQKLAQMELDLARLRNDNVLPASKNLMASTQALINEMWNSTEASKRATMMDTEQWKSLIILRDQMKAVIGVVEDRTDAMEDEADQADETADTEIEANKRVFESASVFAAEERDRQVREAVREADARRAGLKTMLADVGAWWKNRVKLTREQLAEETKAEGEEQERRWRSALRMEQDRKSMMAGLMERLREWYADRVETARTAYEEETEADKVEHERRWRTALRMKQELEGARTELLRGLVQWYKDRVAIARGSYDAEAKLREEAAAAEIKSQQEIHDRLKKLWKDEAEAYADKVASMREAGRQMVADSEDATETMQSGFESLGNAMASAFMDAAEAWGTAAGEGKDATEQWQTGIETFVEALLRALPQIMLTVGIQLLGMGPPLMFVGLGMIVASGIGAGIIAAMDAKDAKTAAEAAATAQEDASAAQEKADVAALKHDLWYDLLSDRNKALYNMNEQIKDYRAAGINDAAIALWEAKERAEIDARYPAGMQFGGVVEGPAGIDTALIRATPGEFVMPVDQTRANLDILEAIRSGGSATPEINIEPMPVEITIDGRTIARAVIGFMGQETDIGGGRINTRVVRATE